MERKKLTALAARAIKGDEKAFEQLYLVHARSILYHVRNSIHDKENYNDVAQEVALKMHKSIKDLREPYAFSSWMHKIIRTTCFNHNRSLKSNAEHEATLENEEDIEAIEDEGRESDPEAVAMATLEGNQLFAIVSQLPATHRDILVQRFYDDMSYKEIAEALDISVTNVSTRLNRAMAAIRKAMGETGAQQGSSDKGVIMKLEDTRQTGGHDEVQDTMGLAPALSAGLALVIPDEAIKTFASTTAAKIAATSTATATTSVTAGSFLRTLPVAIAYIVASVSVVFAVAVGCTAAFTVMDQDGELAARIMQHDYSGTANIEFVDALGGSTDLNVVSAHLIEGTQTSIETQWKLYFLGTVLPSEESEGESTVDGVLLQEGSGSTLDETILVGLAPGNYHVVFTLVDSNGAPAEISRSFTIQEKG